MADRVELAFLRAAKRLIPDGTRVLAAVSGGADSVALLHLLHEVAGRRALGIQVAHLDHGLRRGSRTDRRFVERLARRLLLPCIAARREVSALRRKDESPEEAARRVRWDFLNEAAARAGCRCIVTGHTLDDQAETILMRLVRGAGATALTGMAESGPGRVVRPLLAIEREALRNYLDRRDLGFREDPTNRDLRFDRNRVRRVVLPLLAESLNPRVAKHLVQAARRFREDSLHLDSLAEAAFEELSRRDRAGRLVLDADRLAGLSPVVAKRIARLALRRAGTDARRISAVHIDGLLDLARGGRGRRLHLPSRIEARRDRGRIVVGPERVDPQERMS